jgi:hypothetical protein
MPRQPYLSINFNTGSAQGGPTTAELTKRIRAQIIGNKWTSPGGGLILSIEIPQTLSLKKLSAALQIRNVRIMISNPAFMGSPHLHGFRLWRIVAQTRDDAPEAGDPRRGTAQPNLNLAVFEFSH